MFNRIRYRIKKVIAALSLFITASLVVTSSGTVLPDHTEAIRDRHCESETSAWPDLQNAEELLYSKISAGKYVAYRSEKSVLENIALRCLTGMFPTHGSGESPYLVVGQSRIGRKTERVRVDMAGIEKFPSLCTPPGKTFTTYNFEVEDFHTYFVGESGVWVHNAGAWCQEVFTEFHRINDKVQDIWKSYDKLIKRPPPSFVTKPSRWPLRMFNDVRWRYFNGEAGSFNPPWRDITRLLGQTLNKSHHPTTTLADSMRKVFGIPSPGSQFTPHHIVTTYVSNFRPQMKAASERARAVLAKYNIDINDASNGVFIPNRNAVDNAIDWDLYGPRHRGSHPQTYLDEIADRLDAADQPGASADDIREALQRAAYDIVEGDLPIHIIPE